MTPRGHGATPGAVSLASLENGARGQLVRVEGGICLRTRLMAMGLRAGVEVRVIHNGGEGPFVFAVGELRMVLGRGMANQVLVTPVAAAAAVTANVK